MKKILFISLTGMLVILTGLWFVLFGGKPEAASAAQAKAAKATPTLAPEQEQEVEALRLALESAIQGRDDVISFLMYEVDIDHVDFSQEGNLALVWIKLVDRDSGETIPAEPGLVIARREQDQKSGQQRWKITLQVDANFSEELAKVPDSLLDGEVRTQYQPGQQKVKKDHQVFTGYRLPWEAGLAKRVSGSIGHVFVYKSCPATCLYAFDFADGTMFPVHAAKGGTVKYAIWKYPNGNTKNANYLILEDKSTTPTTYQVYYHLAQDSIPEKFRTAGAEVLQGELIGNADDTGPSTGNHLHFMVHTNSASYWGTSVDITFDEVKDNGGRPRTCAEAAQFPGYGRICSAGNLYVSSNGDVERPTGAITSPNAAAEISKRKLTVTAKGKDDKEVTSVQLFYRFTEDWQQAGEVVKGDTLKTTLDLCALDVPDGPFSLGVKVKDQSGKDSDGIVGEIQVIKKFPCAKTPTPAPNTPTPVPDCRPGDLQVAVFAGTIYSGDCALLDLGEYPKVHAFDPVGNDNIELVKLGRNATVMLYPEGGFDGKPERITVSDVDLGDNVIGRNTVSSLKVQGLIPAPGDPQLTPPNAGDLNKAPTDQDALVLTWRLDEYAEETRSVLTGMDEFKRELDWQTGSSWEVGKLLAGRYTWTVWARNLSGESKASLDFTVKAFDFPPESHMEPLPESLKTSAILLRWVLDEGEQDINNFQVQYRVDGTPWQGWEVTVPGSQRQAWFLADKAGLYEFRMRAVDRGGTVEAYPKEPEAQVQVDLTCEPDAFEKLGDSKWQSPTPLEIGEVQTHSLCPAGDEDWLTFPGVGEQQYQFLAQPVGGSAAVALRIYRAQDLWLQDSQRAQNFGEPVTLEWTAPADDIYLLRITPLDTRLTGEDARYNIKIEEIGKLHPGGLVLSSLTLPVLWFLVKWYLRKKAAGEITAL